MGTAATEGVIPGARRRMLEMLRFCQAPTLADTLLHIIEDASAFHDLGKLDEKTQAELRTGPETRLTWDHIDAGVAHLSACGARTAAWLVRAHHAPGLPSAAKHFAGKSRRLRGRRDDDREAAEHQAQIAQTDATLAELLAQHEQAVGAHSPRQAAGLHGLALRLSLSILVDADHSDSAAADTGWTAPDAAEPRWAERLAALDAYVAGLGDGSGARDGLRRAFYDACRIREPDTPLMACEGPVGIGKTTAVTAYLLRRAIATGARRLFIVAPYTAILTQTAKRLRQALVLPDEASRPDRVIAEHHHRADFASASARDLATLWTAPIVLTTAVQFFETLAGNGPAALRKLWSLPGSVLFLDEAHAALPAPLWPQNWRWLCELADEWSCSFVLASGSLARFWEMEDIAGARRTTLPDLVPPALAAALRQAESARVRYVSDGRYGGPADLVRAVADAPGPRLLIMNTVQSAAVMARQMQGAGQDVLHLSNALCPRDRDVILAKVTRRLEDKADQDWTLVATSLMEAGVDLSFRTAFRERFATTSIIQIGGRANRDGNATGTTVHDFVVEAVDGLRSHPGALIPAAVLEQFFKDGLLSGEVDPAMLATLAMQLELEDRRQTVGKALLKAEAGHDYPKVAKLGRVIDADTKLVVVDPVLRDRIAARERLATRDILAGSVQIWAYKIDLLRLEPLPGRQEVFWWPYRYDPDFLGYMEGGLSLAAIVAGEAVVI